MVWAQTRDSRTDLHIYPHGRFMGTARRGKMDFSGRGTCHMSFKVGDTVVYPHHGAARIEAVETRLIKGEEKTYLVLKVDKGDLTVRVPADNAELVGVRDVVGQDGLEKVFEVLRAPHRADPRDVAAARFRRLRDRQRRHPAHRQPAQGRAPPRRGGKGAQRGA